MARGRNNSVEVYVDIDPAKAVLGLKQIENSVERTVSTFKQFAIAGLVGSTVAAGLKSLIDNASESQEVSIRLEGALKRMGEQAGVTRDQIDDLAASVQRSTKFSDESVKTGATSLLLFDKIRGEVFQRALKDSVDLAAVMGTDVPQAAEALGRALQQPGAGLRVLMQAGVKFNEEEVKTLQYMTEVGRAAEAQGIIFAELEKRINGAGTETRDTLNGALASLKNNLTDLLENDTGITRLTGVINRLADAMKRINENDIRGKSIFQLGVGAARGIYGAVTGPEENLRAGTITRPEIQVQPWMMGQRTLEEETAARKAIEAWEKGAKERIKIEEDANEAIAGLIDELSTKRIEEEIETNRVINEALAGAAEERMRQDMETEQMLNELFAEIALENIEENRNAIDEFKNATKSAFEDMVRTGDYSAKQFVRNFIAELARKELFEAIDRIGDALGDALSGASGSGGMWGAVASGIGFLFGGSRAAGGGDVSGDVMVGEAGPEWLRLGKNRARVLSRGHPANNGGGSGNVFESHINFNVEGNVDQSSEIRIKQYVDSAIRASNREHARMMERNGFGRMR